MDMVKRADKGFVGRGNTVLVAPQGLNGLRVDGKSFWEHPRALPGLVSVAGCPDLAALVLPLRNIFTFEDFLVVAGQYQAPKMHPIQTHALVKVVGDGTEMVLPLAEIRRRSR